MNQITKKTTSKLVSDIYNEMYCNFCFWDARPKNNLLISNFTIFESYYSKGIHVDVFKLCILTNFEVVFLVIWFIS
jgi:hypothetical protein